MRQQRERCQSGRMGRSRKPLWTLCPPWVRIPPSPPEEMDPRRVMGGDFSIRHRGTQAMEVMWMDGGGQLVWRVAGWQRSYRWWQPPLSDRLATSTYRLRGE